MSLCDSPQVLDRVFYHFNIVLGIFSILLHGTLSYARVIFKNCHLQITNLEMNLQFCKYVYKHEQKLRNGKIQF